MLKPTPPKRLDEITREWDIACFNRQRAISTGQDVSLLTVTAPCILNEVAKEKPSTVLDIGCGTGYLTSRIAENVSRCTGIDCSHNSILIAQQNYCNDNISFIETKLEDFFPRRQFDMCISNMVFTSDPDYRASLKKSYSLLSDSGTLLVMITHPCFWPKYWGFEKEPWFDYKREIFIEHDFSISLVKSLGKATYIHRPLDMYISAIAEADSCIDGLEEPYPYTTVPCEYKYEYPRFLLIKCKKHRICTKRVML